MGAILPDTTSSTRYTLYDAPLLTKALKAGGLTPDVQNAQGDKNKFASIAANMIGDGSKVLIIDSIDAVSGAGVEAQADKAGVKVIDYDRPNLGGRLPTTSPSTTRLSAGSRRRRWSTASPRRRSRSRRSS